jgi:hypothetical protein
MSLLIILLVSQTCDSPSVPDLMEIPIEVLNTYEITYASDMQDICLTETQQLAIRSNGDGVIYLADPGDGSYEGEILLPPGLTTGFGLAYSESTGEYYVNSGTEPLIYYSDGSDTWATIPNPAGTDGAGMDVEIFFSDELSEATASSPYRFYCIDAGLSYGLPGITGTVSGFMGYEIMAMGGYPPGAVIATTRYGHEFFFFYESSSDYTLYGQEDCPITVDESLGLAWFFNEWTVLWGYRGTDGKYYVSELWMPIFGGIEEETASTGSPGMAISLSSNPFSDQLGVQLSGSPGPASVRIYSLEGRRLMDLPAAGENTFTWDGKDFSGNAVPAGTYLVVAGSGNCTAAAKVVRLD